MQVREVPLSFNHDRSSRVNLPQVTSMLDVALAASFVSELIPEAPNPKRLRPKSSKPEEFAKGQIRADSALNRKRASPTTLKLQLQSRAERLRPSCWRTLVSAQIAEIATHYGVDARQGTLKR